MSYFTNKVVVVTGGSDGIGRALVDTLMAQGAIVSTCGRSHDKLYQLQTTYAGKPFISYTADVSEEQQCANFIDATVKTFGTIDILINNAGISMRALFAETEIQTLRKVMDINFWGVVHGTQAFLPHLKASGDGHVINISSVFGLVSIPTQSAYNAAKFAVRGFTDALRIELEIDDSGVSATTIHPGGIKTNIARNARVDEATAELSGDVGDPGDMFEKIAMTKPSKAAKQILAAVEKNKRRALIGPDAKVFDLVSRLPAGFYQRLLINGAKRQRK